MPASARPPAPRGIPWSLLAVLALVLGHPGCSNKQKKLSASGGGLGDTLMYDVFGAERDPAYYFALLQRSRDPETFCYRCADDPYLIDKNVDAIQRLGDAPMARLEGQANVISLLMEILLEDRSALARSAAAVTLTKIGARLPRYADTGARDDGSRLASAMGEIQSLYRGGRSPGSLARVAALVTQVGDARFDQGLFTKKALQFFGTTPALIDETDPAVRQALDTALTRKSREAVVYALSAAVEGPTDYVRADAVRGLKVLGEASALETVVERVAVEVSPRVRGEAAEYFGRVGGPQAVRALLPRLSDTDGSVRVKAREALTRVAGQDLGARERPWRTWASQRFPGEDFAEPEPDPAPGGAR